MSTYLRFAAPSQSWAGRKLSASLVRTGLVPTFSGVTGFVAAGLGLPHGVRPDWLNDVKVRVRIDDAGTVQQTMQIVQTRLLYNKVNRASKDPLANRILGAHKAVLGGSVKAINPQPSHPQMKADRTVLAGSQFVVEVDGGAQDDLVFQALRSPVFDQYLGRKAHALTFPYFLGRGGTGLLEKIPHLNVFEEPRERSLLSVFNVTALSQEQFVPDLCVSVPAVSSLDDWLGKVAPMLERTV